MFGEMDFDLKENEDTFHYGSQEPSRETVKLSRTTVTSFFEYPLFAE